MIGSEKLYGYHCEIISNYAFCWVVGAVQSSLFGCGNKFNLNHKFSNYNNYILIIVMVIICATINMLHFNYISWHTLNLHAHAHIL